MGLFIPIDTFLHFIISYDAIHLALFIALLILHLQKQKDNPQLFCCIV